MPVRTKNVAISKLSAKAIAAALEDIHERWPDGSIKDVEVDDTQDPPVLVIRIDV